MNETETKRPPGRPHGYKAPPGLKRKPGAGPKGNFPGVKTLKVPCRIRLQTWEDFKIALGVNGDEREPAVVLDELIQRYNCDSTII